MTTKKINFAIFNVCLDILVSLFMILTLSVSATAQSGSLSRSKTRSDSTYLEKASARRYTDPQEAIRLLNRSLQESLGTQDYRQSARAYVLLGQIYEDIGQASLALNRYQQAMPLWNMLADPPEQAANRNRLGRLQLATGQYDAARLSFQQCLDLPAGEAIHLQCREGLADVKRAAGAFEESEALYNTVNQELVVRQDSIGMARVSAKRSRNFLDNAGDLTNARASYNTSIQQLPEQVSNYEDYQYIEEAKTALDEAVEDKAEQKKLAQSTLSEQQKRSLPPEVKLREQLQLANLELEEGDVEAAAEVLDASDDLITPAVDPSRAAEVHKFRSEVKLKQGDYQSAVAAYQEYVEANERNLALQQKALKQQIAIVQEQGEVDLFMKDFLLRQTEQNLLRNQLQAQRRIIGLLVLLLLAVGIGFGMVRKQEKERRKAYQLLGLKSLRTQMNPHFIFNALNSINNYIAQQDERAANKYLSDFSRLMRMVLEHSQKDFIPFEEELRLLKLYLKLEHARFGEQFKYEIEEAPGLNTSEVEIPPMLLQPFVENAIWHGLRYKSDKGHLRLSIRPTAGQRLRIEIADNGIGRARSRSVKTKRQSQYQSTGLSNTQQRMALLHTLYDKQYELSITDLQPGEEDPGTLVTLSLPL
jgi:two-component system LytT family sensor kinase